MSSHATLKQPDRCHQCLKFQKQVLTGFCSALGIGVTLRGKPHHMCPLEPQEKAK